MISRKRIMCIGNEQGIVKVLCPKCDTPMEKEDGGYSESFSGGEYDQRDYPDYWVCPECNYSMEE